MGLSSAISGGPRFIVPWGLGILATWYGVNAVFMVCAVLAFASLLMIMLVLAKFPATPQMAASLR
jgi:putative effector of murein hydrolase LrgA (UPF0299 family)